MRNTIEDKDKLAYKLDSGHRSTIDEALTEADDWLNTNIVADKDDLYEKMKELQGICDPIIAEVYQNQGHQDDEDFEDF